MALEFALGVISGVVISLISLLFNNRSRTVGSVHEVTHYREAILEQRSFKSDDGTMVQEERVAYIERLTFEVPSARPDRDVRTSAIAGVVVFVVVVAALLLVEL